ncbi:MAG: SIR2 family protein [Paracoccaceae bacterium]
MAEIQSETGPGSSLHFCKGSVDALLDVSPDTIWEDGSKVIQKQITDALNARHLSFLFGSGCSSLRADASDPSSEIGIPTMGPMANEFLKNPGTNADKKFVSSEEQLILSEILGLDLSIDDFSSNLERLMEVLLSTKVFLSSSGSENLAIAETPLDDVINKVVSHVVNLCSKPNLSEPENPILILYQKFFRRLVMRDRALPRPWVFTTNYDLFSERAMDRLAIPYCNGFSGAVERRFNPATFRYSIAEQLDISSKRWAAVDSFVYLCKLHGSINWIEDGSGLFPIRELQAAPEDLSNRVMIYPTPSKQNTSFGAPYSDLFREFQKQIVRDQSVLITLGYGFGDEHVNNIAFQALTIPGFRLIIFGSPETNDTTKALHALGDPRVWFIWGDGPDGSAPAHYFKSVIENFLPEGPGNKIDGAVEKAMQVFSALAKQPEES